MGKTKIQAPWKAEQENRGGPNESHGHYCFLFDNFIQILTKGSVKSMFT